MRFTVYWNLTEPSQNNFQWSQIDGFMNEAQSRNLKVLMTVGEQTPGWAGPCPTCLPWDMADWQDFVANVIARYGWSYDVVFGIWNEPNLNGFLSGDTDGSLYALLFDYANRARNSVNPGARLGAPETSHHAYNSGYFASVMNRIYPWLQPQDIVTVHWYPDGPNMWNYLQYVWVYAGGRQVWLTETGVSTCNDAAQANGLSNILNTFVTTSAAKTFVYVLHNGSNCTEALVRGDWTNRPAFDTYRNWIPPTTGPHILNADEVLWPDQWITSLDGRFTLKYQLDANLVLYRWDGAPLWAINCWPSCIDMGAAGHAIMQADGNFVVYDAGGTPRWHSNTWGNSNAYLVLHNNGNMVIYNVQGQTLWQTGTGWY